MKNSTRNILVGTGLAAGMGAIAAVSVKLTRGLVGVAMDRQEPELLEQSWTKFTGRADSTEYDELFQQVNAAQEKLKNGDCQQVEITSHDGLRLVGHWHCPEHPKRVIVAMHGWRSSWTKDFGLISDFWHRSDCAVLYAEQRGQGQSEGEYMTFGLLERYDCLDWIHWVNGQTGGKLPVYLGGVSMGATTVLMTAGLELPENVRGIAADCGFTSPQEIWKHVSSNNLHISYSGIRSAMADEIAREKISLGADDYSTVEAMEHCKVPVLFIHGSDDHFVPIEMTYRNYKACAGERRLLVVPGAEHGMSYLMNKDAYEAAVRDMWDEFDKLEPNEEKQNEE